MNTEVKPMPEHHNNTESKSKVALFHMYRKFGGGTTSFTIHLYQSLKLIGKEPMIYRVKEHGERNERQLGLYDGVKYRNITIDEALKIVKDTPSLMTAPCNPEFMPYCPDTIPRLMKRGMRTVLHDPTEFEIYNMGKLQKPICIRPAMKKHVPDAIFIPHPYVRAFNGAVETKRPWLAVSIARITFVKRSEIIFEANKVLPKYQRVVFRGGENRLFTRFKIMPHYPSYVQGKTGFPMSWGAAAQECAKAKFAVDMSWFPDDGGGSQYTFMEAWDAGTVNVVHNDWLRVGGEMKDKCIPVNGAEGLAELLRHGIRMEVGDLVEAGYQQLRKHDPVKVAGQIWEELNDRG
jgi:hypothetical protein